MKSFSWYWISCFIVPLLLSMQTFGSIFFGLSGCSTVVECNQVPSAIQGGDGMNNPKSSTKKFPDLITHAFEDDDREANDLDSVLGHNTRFVAECKMPSTFGYFRMRSYSYTSPQQNLEPIVMISGDLDKLDDVVLRVHDQCFTSEVLGSLRCDCREQLQESLKLINRDGGILIYLQQEGRGIGLANKIAAYSLQDHGLDTVDANINLGFKEELREYHVVSDILSDLRIKSVRLVTNNPYKIHKLQLLGVKINSRIPLQIASNKHNEHYLRSKRDRMGHLLVDDSHLQMLHQSMERSDITDDNDDDIAITSTSSSEYLQTINPISKSSVSISSDTSLTNSYNHNANNLSGYAFGKDTVIAAIAAVKAGQIVVVVDDADRENEGDLIMAASLATATTIGFIVRYSSGVICVSLEGERLDALQLPPMVINNEDPKQTAYSVSVDCKHNTTTGISSADRATTFRALANPNMGILDFQRPGHVFPLRYKQNGVLARAGHTEASLDLTRLAGLYPGGVLAEIVHDDGSLMRLEDLKEFSKTHGLILTSVQDIIAYRREIESYKT